MCDWGREISYLGTREVVFCQVLLSSCDIVYTAEQWVGRDLDCFPFQDGWTWLENIESVCQKNKSTHGPECLASLHRGHRVNPSGLTEFLRQSSSTSKLDVSVGLLTSGM